MTTHDKYRNKTVLAPMVRVGTLPTRMLSLDYGADIVYCEEIVDHKMLKCKRIKNDVIGTVDYIDSSEGTVVFRTCPREKDNLIFQIGTSDAERALAVAKLVEQDVSGIDVNMGCPKEFSLKGGMGAALLTQADKIQKILTTLVQGVNIPVTCKIRILPQLEDTLELTRLIESTGVAALAVHARTKDERSRHCNHNSVIKAITQQASIPIIANGGSGDIKCYTDIERFREDTGASSVMIARAAQWNCSVFRKEGMLQLDDLITAYLKYAVDFDNHALNTKYCIQQMLQDLQDTTRGKALLACKTLQEICALWNLEDYYLQKRAEFESRQKKQLKVHLLDENSKQECFKRVCRDNTEVLEVDVKFTRKNYKDVDLPKTQLLMWSRKQGFSQPVYKSEMKAKLFKATVTVDGKVYSQTTWERNKRSAEQSAALACLNVLGLVKCSPATAAQTVKMESLWDSEVNMNGASKSDIVIRTEGASKDGDKCDSQKDGSGKCVNKLTGCTTLGATTHVDETLNNFNTSGSNASGKG